MFKRLIESIKNFFRRLFGGKHNSSATPSETKKPPPPLNNTDLEFLFTELLEGVHQARGQSWALKWLRNIENRVSTERWLDWLDNFGDKLLAAPTPNNELASRMVQLGELEIGDVGDLAYDIGMELLTRNQSDQILEYEGPDVVNNVPPSNTPLNNTSPTAQTPPQTVEIQQEEINEENLPEGEYQTVSLEQLYEMIQQDENLRQMVAQQLGVDTDDPELIMQKLINQYYEAG
ncbi:hypothetical protein [Mastigocoleus testarum]|uniref:Uncharacterized protein n=1 Tax=Mastigocoleus testarum BC008 TaxID=371196 RepID=A0A0V7ZS86_9CYAN|nr:hypothetical protein [Mastigocoleus testarum]KST67433.1 hypothetical protein BC008_30000 [Mastigocoleus testarum BC008]